MATARIECGVALDYFVTFAGFPSLGPRGL